ncbi:MAG TPA: hypothetical protein VK498_04070 [Ferruginibacter sp.]|nr:hypothetical protein [Ferruginibacter sp.]
MNCKTLFLLLICFAGVHVMAQRQITDGVLVYNITIESDKNEAPVSNPLNGAVLTQYISLNQSRSEMKSALGTEYTVYNNRTNKGFILKDYSGQKLMITMNSDNWTQKNQFYTNLKFDISDEYFTIGEYKCKKAIAVTADGKNFTVYFTPDIVISNSHYNNAFAQLPGLPVQYKLQSGNISFIYTLNKILYDPVAPSKYEIPKSGYRVMTYEENQQLKRGDN